MNRLLFISALVACASAPWATTTAADKPNIIHIMVDDAGLGDFTSFWADSPVQTPNLDVLAAQGMRFTQAYCGAANCAPSRSALMTGRHLGHAYMRSNAGSISIRDVDVTIAEVLQQAGYTTGGYGKWGLGAPGSPGVPERQGFDEFVGYYDQVHAHSHYPDRLYDSGAALIIPENASFSEPETGLVPNQRVHAHSIIFDRMRSFVQSNAQSQTPFYAWGAWTPPHRKSTLNESEADPGGLYHLYDKQPGWDDFDKIQAGFVTWIDQQVGELQQVLADPDGNGDTADSVLDNTLIIFTSDNGGWQSQHNWDRNIETRDGQTVDIRGAKEGYYEGGLRTPMIAYWPGKIAAGSEAALPVAFYDYMPTFAELAGVTEQLPVGADGVSFAPTLTGVGMQQQREGLYFEGYAYNPNQDATQIARIGDWKMIRHRGGAIEMFDLAGDPSETTNRAGDPTVRDVRDQLTSFILRNHAPITAHFSVLPPNVGTGNANRDGVMAFGVRPDDESRNWHVAEAGDGRNLSGAVRDESNSPIDVFLNDLHMVYTVDLSLERTAAPAPEVAIELVGSSGFTYFTGAVQTDALPIGTAQALQVTLDAVGNSPSTNELATDLGSTLSLRLTHDGEAGDLLASNIALAGADAVLTLAPLLGDLTGDGAVDAADWLVFRANLFGDLSGLSSAEALARGDLNGDGRNDEQDFELFKLVYNGIHGADALAKLAASVPELSSWKAASTLAALGVAACSRGRCRSATSTASAH